MLLRVKRLVIEIAPVIESSLKTGDDIVLTKAQYSAGVELLKAIKGGSSPKLKKALSRVLDRLESGKLLKQIGVELSF